MRAFSACEESTVVQPSEGRLCPATVTWTGLSSQSPAEPASSAVPAAATQQQDEKNYDENRGEIHVRDPLEVGFIFRVRGMHSNPDQRSRSPARSIEWGPIGWRHLASCSTGQPQGEQY